MEKIGDWFFQDSDFARTVDFWTEKEVHNGKKSLIKTKKPKLDCMWLPQGDWRDHGIMARCG